jgi:DNA-3-methyladenine glycosylase I
MARRPPAELAERARCGWASTSDPLYRAYHDREWGVPLHDDRRLFELLCLEGAQAGLAWITILRKRAGYRRAFDRFDPRKIAGYRAARIRSLLADPGIVRNRLKVEGVVRNARAFLGVREELGSFDRFVWSFVGGEPRRNAWRSLREVPARTPESDALSKALQKRGFTFVGSTICYAFMQAAGLVNDHVVDCFRHSEVAVHRGRTWTAKQFKARTPVTRRGIVKKSKSDPLTRRERP